MDSRLILAVLLKAGVKPNCMTYGNPQSRDVILAREIAKRFGLNFHNACQDPPNKDWYFKWAVETIKCDDGNSHLHRAHRMAAIVEHFEIYHPKVLFTGHMGGEGMRRFKYNDYLTSKFFEWVNEGKKSIQEAIVTILDDYFINPGIVHLDELIEMIRHLPWMKHDKNTNIFFFLYEFDAKIHHSQDLRLYNKYVPNVVPVFLQYDYLKVIFSSKYNFISKNDNVFQRLMNPELYCRIINEIYPPLMNFPFSNGYAPSEYMKGLWYYIPAKLYHDLTKKRKYPVSFPYGEWYADFILEHSRNISPEFWEIYDKKRYMEEIDINKHNTEEGYWHKFSNPIFFDLVKKYKEGKLN